MNETKPTPSYCVCGHTKEEHATGESTHCKKEGCLCPSYHYDIHSALLGIGLAAGLTGLLGNVIFGGKKMFGIPGTGDVDLKAKDVVYVLIDGFMGYYQEKERELSELKETLEKTKDELEHKNRHYEEMSALAKRNGEVAEEWKSKYMKMVSNARKKKK